MNFHDKLFRKMLRKKGSSVSGFIEYLSKNCALLHYPRIVYHSVNYWLAKSMEGEYLVLGDMEMLLHEMSEEELVETETVNIFEFKMAQVV